MSTTTSDHDPGTEGGAGLSIPCCPPLEPDTACTVIDFRYRLVHPTQVALADRTQTVPVEVFKGVVAPGARALVTFEEESALPTPGIVVKGCLDECDICEREVHRRIHLELDRSELENALLRKQIDLLEKSQEYRCCPCPEASPPEE